jgi:hypothetical protein
MGADNRWGVTPDGQIVNFRVNFYPFTVAPTCSSAPAETLARLKQAADAK